jgi:hypothetical protein
MRRVLAIALLLAACEKDQLEKLEAPAPAPIPTPSPPVPPPPPPPPPEPTNAPPPDAIVEFVRNTKNDPGPWRVQFRTMNPPRSGSLSQADADDFVKRLLEDSSYMTGDSGCTMSPRLHVTLHRGSASLALGVDCDHLYLSPEDHEGPWILFSSEMLERVRDLSARVLQ